MIRTEGDLIALDVGTVVVDSAGSEWVREDHERQWRGMDAPYPVLVETADNWVEFLDDNPYMPSTVALDYGPFRVKETTGDLLGDWFRRIGTSLSDDDYETGIQVLADHDRKIAAEVREQVAREVEAERENTEDGSGVEAYLSGLKRGIEIARADHDRQIAAVAWDEAVQCAYDKAPEGFCPQLDSDLVNGVKAENPYRIEQGGES